MRAVLPPRLVGLIERYLPGTGARAVNRMGEGLDHVAWLVDDEVVVRQAKAPDPAAIRREAALLDLVLSHAPLPVPRVLFADPDSGTLAYRYLPGEPLMGLDNTGTDEIAAQLGQFLAAIHAIPTQGLASIVEHDDDPLTDWLEEARASYPAIAGHIPARERPRIEAFLNAPSPPDPKTFAFCHNDFGAEHILVDPATMRITGIIDWADAAITDPVRDLALVFRDLGPSALETAMAAYGRALRSDEHARLVFHARCKLLEDLAFGLEAGEPRYHEAALAHLDWTFGAT